jgi:hypothetical protein
MFWTRLLHTMWLYRLFYKLKKVILNQTMREKFMKLYPKALWLIDSMVINSVRESKTAQHPNRVGI